MNSAVTDFILDGQSVVRSQVQGEGGVQKTWLHGARGPEYERTGSGDPVWYLYDGLGSVTGTVDVNGNLVSTRKYDVYGAVRGSTGPSGPKHKYVGSLGHPSEDETGLIYMRTRYMDPVTGRFVSEDSARDGANWYRYALNNPANARDPRGTSAVSVHDQVMLTLWAGSQFATLALIAIIAEGDTKLGCIVATCLAELSIVTFGLAAIGKGCDSVVGQVRRAQARGTAEYPELECTTENTESTENTRTILWEGVIPTRAGPLSTSLGGRVVPARGTGASGDSVGQPRRRELRGIPIEHVDAAQLKNSTLGKLDAGKEVILQLLEGAFILASAAVEMLSVLRGGKALPGAIIAVSAAFTYMCAVAGYLVAAGVIE